MPRLPGFEAQFSSVVDQIQSCALDGTGWHSALAGVSDFVGAQCADLTFFNPAARKVGRYESGRIDLQIIERYLTQYVDVQDPLTVHPRLPFLARAREGDCDADSDTWSDTQRARGPYFELLHLMGIGDALTAYVRKGDDGRTWVPMLLFYDAAAGVPQSATRRRVRLLVPHIRRAFCAEERLLAARRESATLAAALDGVAEAVALIDAAGRVVRANRLALDLLRRQDGLLLAHDERLIFVSPAGRDAFARALAECANPLLLLDKPSASPPAQVMVQRREQRPLILTLQALPAELKGTFRAVAILFIADPESKPADARAALRAAYSLSPTEARLVQALCEGLSLREFATANSTSYETVRSYVRRIFMKTGARRQSDLVRLTRTLR